jgi:hypothetical protein
VHDSKSGHYQKSTIGLLLLSSLFSSHHSSTSHPSIHPSISMLFDASIRLRDGIGHDLLGSDSTVGLGHLVGGVSHIAMARISDASTFPHRVQTGNPRASVATVIAFQTTLAGAAGTLEFPRRPWLSRVAVTDKVRRMDIWCIANGPGIASNGIASNQKDIQNLHGSHLGWKRSSELIAVQQELIEVSHQSNPPWNWSGQFVPTQVECSEVIEFANPFRNRSLQVVALHDQVLDQ